METTALDNLIPTIGYFINRKSSPSWNLENSIINFSDLTFVYAGQAVYIVDGMEYRLKQGDFIHIRKGSSREAYTYKDNPVQCYALNFDWIPSQNNNETLPLPSVFRVGIFSELMDLYKELDSVWVEKGPCHILKARAIFMLILHKLLCIVNFNKLSCPPDHRIKKIKEYIHENYHTNLLIDDLAGLFGLNPVYLGALFKKYTDCSIKEYINRVRVNISEDLLRAGGYSVSEAAQRCGFNDIFYFSKVFKKYKGFPPSEVLKK